MLEHIFGQLQKQAGDLAGLDIRCTDRFVLLDKLKQESDRMRIDIEDLKKKGDQAIKDITHLKNVTTELENKSISTDEQVSNANAGLENAQMNLALLD